MTATDKEIKAWKAQFGDLYEITVDEYSCIVRKPNRKDLSYISAMLSSSDPIKATETMLNQLWVAGDEVIKQDDELFLAASSKLGEVVNIKEAEIKKL